MTVLLHDGFETGFHLHDGNTHIEIPEGWQEVHYGNQAEWKPRERVRQDQEDVYRGDWSLSVHVRFNTHDAYIWRKLQVDAGTPVKFNCMTSLVSHIKSGHGARIGIDPYGSIDPYSPNVQWSNWYATHNRPPHVLYEEAKWVDLEVQAISSASFITLFICSKNDWGHELAAAHFDEVVVSDISAGDPPDAALMEIRNMLQGALTRLDELLES